MAVGRACPPRRVTWTSPGHHQLSPGEGVAAATPASRSFVLGCACGRSILTPGPVACSKIKHAPDLRSGALKNPLAKSFFGDLTSRSIRDRQDGAAGIAQLLIWPARLSFVPPADIRQLRSLTRYRRALVNERTRAVQRVEKALQDAGVKLTSVASTVLTKSGRAMLEALVAGVRDPGALAELAKGRLRPKVPQLREALAGNFDHRHAVIVAECLAHIDGIDASVEHISAEVALLLEPHRWAIELLVSIPGVQLRTAEVIIAEIGSDMSVFPTAGHLASWAGLCPGNYSSAGRSTKGTTRPGSPWLQKALVEAALSASHSHSSYWPSATPVSVPAGKGKGRRGYGARHLGCSVAHAHQPIAVCRTRT